ncbi:MAG: translation elongation factor Ts [Clostridia bacterium]
MVTTDMIKELRTLTGAGILDCRNALRECEGNVEEAVDYLRAKGLASAAKKSGRIASEGVVTSYIHGNGKIGVLVEVNCETDFVAKNEDFQNLAKDIAMQIAAARPEYVRREEVPAEVIEKERAVIKEMTLNEGKPEHIVDKIVDGRMNKFFNGICLLEQPFIKDTDKTVEDLLKEKIAAIGENIQVRRFTRYEMGEGIEKKQEDFADEVASMIK